MLITTITYMINKTYIEFYDHIFALEDVICVEKNYSWYEDGSVRKWYSMVYLIGDKCFKFKSEHYNEIKDLLISNKRHKK